MKTLAAAKGVRTRPAKARPASPKLPHFQRSEGGTSARATASPSDARAVEREVDEFLGRFEPAIATLARNARRWMRKRLPMAIEFVYDNYYALVFGFGPSERPSEAIFSIVVYPRHVSVCFLQGAVLPDADHVLNGSGKQVRHIRIGAVADLETPPVKAIFALALEHADDPMPPTGRGRVIIRAIAARRQPRRPRT